MASRLTLRSSVALVALAAFLLQTAPWPVLHAWHMVPPGTPALFNRAGNEPCRVAIGARPAGAEHWAGCAVCAAVAQTRTAVPVCAVSGDPAAAELATPVRAPDAHPPLVEIATAGARAPPAPVS